MSDKMRDCIFCKINENDIILESKLSIAFFDIFPVSNGHMLIIPKKHTISYFNLDSEERSDIWQLVNKAKKYLDINFEPNGYNIGINDGKISGQTVFHCHIHLIPRYKGDTDDPQGGVRRVIGKKQNIKSKI